MMFKLPSWKIIVKFVTYGQLQYGIYCVNIVSEISSDSFLKMPPRRELSAEIRALIIAYHKSGTSNRQIAKKMKIPHATVDYNIKKYRESGSFLNKRRSGRPRATTSADDRRIVVTSKLNRRKTAPEITAELNVGRPKPVSVSTVKRRLQKAGLHGRIAMKKPLLRKQNKQKRLKWAREHQHWTIEEWKNVLWTDESKFELFGTRRRVFVRRSVGERTREECIAATVKHGGGSVMVWGCFAGTSVGDIAKIDGILKKEGYRDILENHAIPSGIRLLGQNFIFQQDNDPKHSSKLCKDYLRHLEEEGTLKIMEWPPQSPDLNPIELLWEELDRQVRKSAPTSTTEMWNKLQSSWTSISEETLAKLIARMPRLCAAIIKSRGGHIDESKI